jgi:hypothetical protein
VTVPRFEPPKNGFMQAHRGRLVLLAIVLALVGVGQALRSMNLMRALYGRGYVPWVEPAWKAKQAAAKGSKALVVFTVDARHPAAGRLEALTPEESVELLIDRLVWYREARPAEGAVAAPTLEVVTADMETTLAGPWTIDETTTAATLRGWLQEGLDRAPP